VKNLDSIFWAYTLGWAIFFGFYLSIAKRSSVCAPKWSA